MKRRTRNWLTLGCALLMALNTACFAAEPAKWIAEHFPEKLTDAEGNEVALSTLSGKAVGIYFSAHWCPPCRKFTPKLVNYRDANKDKFEVVFVSSDRSAAAQKKYMEETQMKWATVGWRSPAAKLLKEKYKVRGIPKLVILKPNGEVFTEDGRGFIAGKKDIGAALASAKKE